jgi:membrane protein YdbS with pleckstrin-like domain
MKQNPPKTPSGATAADDSFPLINTPSSAADRNDDQATVLPLSVWLRQQAAHARLQRLIALPVIGALLLIQLGLYWLVPDYPLPLLLGLLVAAVLAAVGIFWYIDAAHRRYAFRLDDLSLRIRQGVVWQKETAVPLNRVQHTDITQGPLQRRYGLARLVIHTAGTRHAVVNLDGVTHRQARALRQALSFDAHSGAV